MANGVRVGVEWINIYPQQDPECPAVPSLRFMADCAEGFLLAMRSCGHDDIFDWGNDNAWSSDFDHPDFGGDSVRWSDNVHFCYVAGHGGSTYTTDPFAAFNIGFSSRHIAPGYLNCRSISTHWKLGANRLKWFALDTCDVVRDTVAAHIVKLWAGPMQGLHLLLGFIGMNHNWPSTRNRRISFGLDICRGVPIANAWLDTGCVWEDPDHPVRPIAIAAGFTRDEAIARREGETLSWLWFDVRATNWLAWKWRG
jgi:hypothetical protein